MKVLRIIQVVFHVKSELASLRLTRNNFKGQSASGIQIFVENIKQLEATSEGFVLLNPIR